MAHQASRLAHRALRLSPLSFSYLPILGNAYRVTRQYESAIATYQKILTLIPHHVTARAGLAAVYSELGREKEAQATLPEVLKHNSPITLEHVRLRLPLTVMIEVESTNAKISDDLPPLIATLDRILPETT